MALPITDIFGKGLNPKVTSPYGKRKAPTKGASTYHTGVDLLANEGTPIHSLASGKVSKIGYDSKSGHFLNIDHGNGYVTRHAHLRERPNLQVGSSVEEGQKIAHVGKTGNVTGAHLHLGLEKDGQKIDITKIPDLQKHINSEQTNKEVKANELIVLKNPSKEQQDLKEEKAVSESKNFTNMASIEQNKRAPQKDAGKKPYRTEGMTASQIMGKSLSDISENELMTLAMNQGYSRRDAKRAFKGLEKFNKLQPNEKGVPDMVFDPNANRYNVVFKNAEGNVEVDPRQGRKLGSNVALGAADLIGLGRDVNMLASVINRKRFSKTPEIKEEAKTQTKEFPTYNLEDFSSKLKSQMETGLKPQPFSLRRTGTTPLDETPIITVPPKKPENFTGGGEQDAHFAHVGNVKPKSEEYADIPLWQDFASRAMASVARVAGAPAYAAEGLTNFFGLPTEGFGQKAGERSLIGKYADWTRKKEAEYLEGLDPNRGGWLYRQTANAPEYAVAGRAVKGLFPNAKNAKSILAAPKPPTSKIKPLIGTFKQDATGAAKAAKAAADAATKARQANKVKATIERAGQIRRMSERMGEGFEKGGIIGARDLMKRPVNDMGLPKYQNDGNLPYTTKNAGIDPNRATFRDWIKTNGVNIARYAAPFIGESIARKELNVKPMNYTPTDLMLGVVRDLPKTYQPMLNRVENRGSDLLTNIAGSKFTDAYNQDKQFQWNVQNQMSKLQQQSDILNRSNQSRMFNAQNKMNIDRMNMMKDLQLADARYRSKLSPMLAVNQMVSEDINQKNQLDAYVKGKQMEIEAKKGQLSPADFMGMTDNKDGTYTLGNGKKVDKDGQPVNKRGGKFKIKK